MANIYSVNLGGSAAFSAVQHADLEPTANFTMGVWLKSSQNSGGLIQNYHETSNFSGYLLQISGHKARLIVGDNTSGFQSVSSTTSIDDGAWHWIVGTFDGTNARVYIDGNATPEGTQAVNACVYDGSTVFRIGCKCSDTSTNNDFVSGNMDEVFIIKGTALTGAQINQKYKNYIVDPNLKGYWQFENNGNDTADTHTLTNIGSPTYQTDVPFSISSTTNYLKNVRRMAFRKTAFDANL